MYQPASDPDVDNPRMPRPEIKPSRHLFIPVQTSTPEDEECARLRERGQFLARQDRWAELSKKILAAENARDKTPGGMPVSELLAFGARSDVVAAAQHGIDEEASQDEPALLSGIGGLEAVLEDHPGDHAIALTVALAHVDIGWAWRGSDAEQDVSRHRKSAFAAHFDRAASILDDFDGVSLNSPALAAARCALLPGLRDPKTRVADDYEDLIDLDPDNERHMRALGNHLLPRWFGDYAQLELEARRTAARTRDIWGNAGYTWVMFDAIANDSDACGRLDADYFVDGLRDILDLRRDQATANLLAAYCAIAIGAHNRDCPNAQRIADCADWIIRDHLTELHPLIWAHAAEGFDNAAPVSSLSRFAAYGKDQAMSFMGRLFADEISRGLRVVFTPDGLQITT
jgi:hypothetical protein